jgi:hypothetical protein
MNNKEHLKKLNQLVSNHKAWEQFSSYLDYLIAEQHRVMEQTDSGIILNRMQGSIMTLRKLKKLRDEVNSNG